MWQVPAFLQGALRQGLGSWHRWPTKSPLQLLGGTQGVSSPQAPHHGLAELASTCQWGSHPGSQAQAPEPGWRAKGGQRLLGVRGVLEPDREGLGDGTATARHAGSRHRSRCCYANFNSTERSNRIGNGISRGWGAAARTAWGSSPGSCVGVHHRGQVRPSRERGG